MANSGVIVLAFVILLIFIGIIVLFFFLNIGKPPSTTPSPASTATTFCGGGVYTSQNPPVCNFASGNEIKILANIAANQGCPVSKEFANPNCSCSVLCQSSKTCAGSTSTTVYTGTT